MSVNDSQNVGKLTVIYGPMFSGKTTYLVDQYDDGEEVVVFKPDLDERYTKKPMVVTHDGEVIPSVLVDHKKPSEMAALVGSVGRVLIDEANFFEPKALIKVIKEFLAMEIDVYVDGLTMDSEGEVWEPMTTLVTMADEKVEKTARCDGENGTCGEPATHTYCKIPKKERIQVAGAKEYGAACLAHYKELHRKQVK